MNHGKFFSLDLAASRLDEGISVFDYTDIFDASIKDGESKSTPRYPIFVSITSTSVKFILQYCVYLKNVNQSKDKQEFVATIDPDDFNGDFAIRHMEEVLIELPITTTSGLSLAATLKRLYSTPFPICLQTEKNYFLELVKDRYEFGVGHQYVLKRADDKNESNLHYSVLSIWNLYDKDFGYILFDNSYKYNKVLRKLILDFFFDMMHSDVFKNSVHHDEMYSTFMSDFFCSAIIRKAEYYYQRALVNQQDTDPQKITNSISIYAENLEIAEQRWVKCIQARESDRHFEFQPKWFEPDNSVKKSFLGNFKSWLKEIFCPLYQLSNPDSWFASPEDELRGVTNHSRKDDIACSRHLLSRVKKSKSSTIDLSYFSQNNISIQQRTAESSKWLLKRYAFKDAYQLAWGKYLDIINWLVVAAIILISFFGFWNKLVPQILFLLVGVILIFWTVFYTIKHKNAVTFDKTIFLYPRLVAAIVAAWFSIALSDSLFKTFFYAKFSWVTVILLLTLIFFFVLYEVHRTVPKIGMWSTIGRSIGLMMISCAISLVVGICVINFTGEKMLEKSGVLTDFYRDNVILTSNVQDDEPSLILDFDDILASDKWSDSLVINTYTHSIPGNIDAAQARYAVHEFANTPYGEDYMNRIVHAYSMLHDSARVHDSTLVLSDSIRGRFLLRHENNALFMDLLPYVKHTNDGHPIAEYVNVRPLKWCGIDYSIFILYDFLIQFAVIAMFIGIFIQMIFEEKNVTES
jgi:hypothetical protein